MGRSGRPIFVVTSLGVCTLSGVVEKINLNIRSRGCVILSPRVIRYTWYILLAYPGIYPSIYPSLTSITRFGTRLPQSIHHSTNYTHFTRKMVTLRRPRRGIFIPRLHGSLGGCTFSAVEKPSLNIRPRGCVISSPCLIMYTTLATRI